MQSIPDTVKYLSKIGLFTLVYFSMARIGFSFPL